MLCRKLFLALLIYDNEVVISFQTHCIYYDKCFVSRYSLLREKQYQNVIHLLEICKYFTKNRKKRLTFRLIYVTLRVSKRIVTFIVRTESDRTPISPTRPCFYVESKGFISFFCFVFWNVGETKSRKFGSYFFGKDLISNEWWRKIGTYIIAHFFVFLLFQSNCVLNFNSVIYGYFQIYIYHKNINKEVFF